MHEPKVEPKYEVLDITPDIAASFLEHNTRNRNIRDRIVDMYAEDMLAGKWEGENGQTIVIADDDRVIDGQHRLWAIVQSETTQRMLVVSGVPMSAQLNVDTQSKRTFGDMLKLEGESYPTVLAAIVRRIAMWQRHGQKDGRMGAYTPSNAQLVATLEEHPDLRAAAVVAYRAKRRVRAPTGTLGLCYWLFSHIHYDDCAHFFALLCGEHDGLERGHPLRTLIETVGHQPSKVRLPELTHAAYMIKTWNAYRAGRELRSLRFAPGGKNPEKFPDPQ